MYSDDSIRAPSRLESSCTWRVAMAYGTKRVRESHESRPAALVFMQMLISSKSGTVPAAGLSDNCIIMLRFYRIYNIVLE